MTLTTESLFFDLIDRSATTDRFSALRQSARNQFREQSFPTLRTEDWRFTNLAPLLGQGFELPARAPTPQRELLPPIAAANAVRLIFVNGKFTPALSHIAALPAGIVVGSLTQTGIDRNPRLKVFLGQVADYQEQIFTALNTALLEDGAFVLLPDGKVFEQPIEILYVTEPGGQPVMVSPRTLIVAGKASQATVIERYLGPAGVYFNNAVTEIALGDGAVVDHCKILQESFEAYHIATTQVLLDGRSNFTTTYLALGGGLVRNEVRVRFDGEGAEATVNGLYLGRDKQHLDSFTVIDHAKPHCNSHELYKGVLGGHSHGVFNGKIFVREGAQKTDAKQTNKVLLLSDHATINTKPQLEIFADDVKCTHGATIGQLDAEQLFYLQSRGIGLAQARALLTFAFANDLVNRIKVESIRDQLERLLIDRNL